MQKKEEKERKVGGGGELRHRLVHFSQKLTHSRWFIDLNVKGKTIKLLTDDLGENLDVLALVITFRHSTKGTVHKRLH